MDRKSAKKKSSKRTHSPEPAKPDESKADVSVEQEQADMGKVDKKKQRRNAAKQEKKEQAEDVAHAAAEAEEKTIKQQMEEAQKWLDGLTPDDVINQELFKPEKVAEMKAAFQAGKPFPHHFMANLMDNEFLLRLKDELFEEEFYQKSNDLYDFLQTHDLKQCKKPLVVKMRELLYSEKFRNLLTQITGIALKPFDEGVDLFAAIYQDTHNLLCHDDELDQRRIAFIFYLVPENWSEADGGSLDLFSVDAQGQPDTVTKSIVPQWNSFAFFEVSPVSYHQVREVTSKKSRLSIGGWYYGEPIARAPHPREAVRLLRDFDESEDIQLDDWVNRQYRRKNVVEQAKKQFRDESALELANFLRKDKYDALVKALTTSQAADWAVKGPANKRHFSVYQNKGHVSAKAASAVADDEKEADGPALILGLKNFLHSQAFADFIQGITDLEPAAGTCEVRRFSAGDYTLGHDQDAEAQQPGLDLSLCVLPCPTKKWKEEFGGVVHYADEGATEELIAIPPAENTLSIVYRAEPGTLKFVKYVNHRAPGSKFDFNCLMRVTETGDTSDAEPDDEEKDGPADMDEEEEPADSKKSAAKKKPAASDSKSAASSSSSSKPKKK